jgi:YVTN family beta-propeller protein
MIRPENRSRIALVLTVVFFVFLVLIASQSSTWAAPGTQGTIPRPGVLYLPLILKNFPSPTPNPNVLWVNSPNGLVSDSQSASPRNRLYVASRDTNSVTVWDEVGQTTLKTIPVGYLPWGMAIANNRVFVGNFGSNSVSVIDAETMNKMTPDIDLSSCGGGVQPAYIAANILTKRVYVALYASGKVAVIDSTNNNLVGCLDAGAGTFGVAINPWLGQLYVTNRNAMNLMVFDISTSPETLRQTVPLSGKPFFVQADLSQSGVYFMLSTNGPKYNVANALQIYGATLDSITFNKAVVIGNTYDGGAIWVSQARGGSLYIAASADNQLQIVESVDFTLFQNIAITDPFAITQNYWLNRMYITSRSTGWVTVQSDSLGAPDRARTPQRK